MPEDLDLESLTLGEACSWILKLFNLIETVQQECRTLAGENRQLRDEILRLKGEQGPPQFPKKKSPMTLDPKALPSRDVSSETERFTPKEWHKRAKNERIRINRTETVAVDRTLLPPDAVFKGYDEVIVQDLLVLTDNVKFRKEKFYSSSRGRTYLAPLPPGYEGEFGPNVKALALSLCYGANVSEAKIREFFDHAGLSISVGGLSNLLSKPLIQGEDRFHEEKSAVFEAGLRSSPWHHLDETGTRVKGVNHYCHAMGNPLYTVYFTLPSKRRLGVVQALRGEQPVRFGLNFSALEALEATRLPLRVIEPLRRWIQEVPEEGFQADELSEWLKKRVPDLGPKQLEMLREAMALAAYRTDERAPALLVCDDAPQWKGLTREIGLCWVHEGRHYKKLLPWVPFHRQLLAAFLKTFWDYYRELGSYRDQPTPEESERLSKKFDTLFGSPTGYADLDARMALTRKKKTELLAVLRHPEIPLHNNPAELAARRRVSKRKVSFGPQSEQGSRAWDTFMTLAATTAQLGIRFSEYLKDRITQAHQIPPLGDLITERARTLSLGNSWVTK